MPEEERGAEPESVDWGSVDMSPEAKRHYEKYVRWLREDFAEADATSLVILVWGPGAGAGSDVFRKREEIRGRLRQRGDTALFSEDLDEVCREFSESARVRELFQAYRADFVIVLYRSPGSIAEVHDIAKALASKILVFIDSRHVEGYGFTGLLREMKASANNVETFEYPRDIQECHLMAAIEKKLKKLRVAKWWAQK